MHIGSFQTIESGSTGLYKEKGSKFLAYAYPIDDESAVKIHLEKLKKEHPKARHHCYAFRLLPDGRLYRANDDGEPSGTAGKPILGQLLSYNLTDVLVVVVRYFGGTKLGASGLIQAYKAAARDALEQASICTRIVTQKFQIAFPFAVAGEVMQALSRNQVTILNENYTSEGQIAFSIPVTESGTILHHLKSQLAGFDGEDAAMDDVLVEKKIKIYPPGN